MRGDVSDLLVEFGMKIVAGRVAHQPRTRAVAAIARTTIRHEKQNAVGIPMHESRHGRMRIFAARVAHFPRRGVRFLDARHHLLADRAKLVRRVNEVEKIRRDGERELVVGEFCARMFLRRERGQKLLQLLDRGDAVLHLPAPVVPVGVGNVMPETPSGGFESLQRFGPVVRRRLLTAQS